MRPPHAVEPTELVILGAGWYALEIAEYAEDSGWRVAGLVELLDESRVGGVQRGRPILGMEDLADGTAAIAAGGGDRRAAWSAAAKRGARAVRICHPTASISRTARIDSGAIVGPMAVVGAESSIGAHAILSRGALVGHHVEVGAFCRLLPGANVAGHVRIGAGAVVGMGAGIAEHLTVGDDATVAAAAMVLRDVAEGTRVQGVPARPFSAAR